MEECRVISGKTGLTGLLGSPVEHSVSPFMHNEAFQKLGLDFVYLCFDVQEDRLETAVEGLKTLGVRGFNLTMPDKNKMAELADELSPAAKLIGAVNTVVNDAGRLTGHNTDGIGYMRSAEDAGYDVVGGEMTILGAGGAASAICVQAALDGVKRINIFARKNSRFHQRTVEMVDAINGVTGCSVLLWEQNDLTSLKRCLRQSMILVNATSVGMQPETGGCLIRDAGMLRPELIVSDVIYHPRETRLLKIAKAAGCRVFNGMHMLLYQGAEAFRLWTGREMPVDAVKEKYFAG